MSLRLNHSNEASELGLHECLQVSEVLSSHKLRMERRARLLEAIALPGTEVWLFIESLLTCTRIRTRILAAGDDRVVLEHGLSVPMQCIHRVEIISQRN